MSNHSTHRNIVAQPPGWLTAAPLENYSSINELSLINLLGYKLRWPRKHFFLQFSFNLHTPLELNPQAYLSFHMRDANTEPLEPKCCYSITNLKRWRLDISSYRSMDDYLNGMIRWHRCNYTKSEKTFNNYGCKVTISEGDWSEYADEAYRLYANVAHRYGDWLYDLHFFRSIAKRPDYKLMCAWLGDEMIGIFVLQEELPTLHSICVGFDYHHSSACYAYSWMHYVMIKYAIESGKYQQVDVGMTADDSKKTIGFKPVASCIDVYSKSRVTRGFLRTASRFITSTIHADAKLKFKWRSKKLASDT